MITLSTLSVRLCWKLDGELTPDDAFHADLEDIRLTDVRSLAHVLTRRSGRWRSGIN